MAKHHLINKKWRSDGAVWFSNDDLVIPGSYPRYGVVFQMVEVNPAREADGERDPNEAVTGAIPYWELNANRLDRQVRRIMNQPKILLVKFKVFEQEDISAYERVAKPSDPPQDDLSDSFVADMEDLVFSEVSSNCFVAQPMYLKDDNGNVIEVDDLPLSVTFVMNFYEKTQNPSRWTMIQRAFWSNGYIGVYCCPEYV